MDKIHVPDDIFHFLATFLTPVDCMSFCLSGVSSDFTNFYSRRRIWNLSHRFCLKPNIFQQYFSKYMSPNVRVLDLSYCFWLPETTLLNGLFSLELKNLTELNLLDTKLSLVSVILQVMPQCPDLTKLSVNIAEPTWTVFDKKLQGLPDTYKENFKKITDLKLYILDCSSPYIWILLFNVLGWCRDCVQLHMELFQSEIIRKGSPCENNQSECESVIQLLSKANLYDGLKWMNSLKGLCILTSQPDRCFDDFCRWLLYEVNPLTLEKLWIPSAKLSPSLCIFKPWPSFLCLNVGRFLNNQFDFTSLVFEQLTHLAGIEVNSDLKLPQLTFLRGNFPFSSDLDEFCSSHPQLEHLHFDGYGCTSSSQENRINFQCQWALARLRTLIFSNNPHPDVLIKFMHSCSKLEELYVGQLTSSIFLAQEPLHEAYRSISKQTHLRKLTLCGLEFTCGSFLQQVLGNCRSLESLHIAGQFENNETFFSDLSKNVHLAKNLRDLRIQKAYFPDYLLLDLILSIKSCSNLERLMIYQDDFNPVSKNIQIDLPSLLGNLVTNQLSRLMVFCFVYPLISTAETEIISQLGSILQSRPSFWYHIDSYDLPKNTSSPRVHLGDFIDPFPYIDSFPVFE